MTTCYHGPCDIYDPTNNNQIHWQFLLQTTQALIGENIVEIFLFYSDITMLQTQWWNCLEQSAKQE